MAEKDGDLEGILHAGVSSMESVEGCGGNTACIEVFIATGFRVQRERKVCRRVLQGDFLARSPVTREGAER